MYSPKRKARVLKAAKGCVQRGHFQIHFMGQFCGNKGNRTLALNHRNSQPKQALRSPNPTQGRCARKNSIDPQMDTLPHMLWLGWRIRGWRSDRKVGSKSHIPHRAWERRKSPGNCSGAGRSAREPPELLFLDGGPGSTPSLHPTRNLKKFITCFPEKWQENLRHLLPAIAGMLCMCMKLGCSTHTMGFYTNTHNTM